MDHYLRILLISKKFSIFEKKLNFWALFADQYEFASYLRSDSRKHIIVNHSDIHIYQIISAVDTVKEGYVDIHRHQTGLFVGRKLSNHVSHRHII